MRAACLSPAVLLILANSAAADPILNVRINQGTLGDFGVVSASTVCSATGQGPSVAQACGGNLPVGTSIPGVGHFNGSGEAAVSTSAGLSLGSSAAIDVWRVNDQNAYFGSGDRYFAAVLSSAGLSDSVTVQGSDGLTSGILQLIFSLDGSITTSFDEFTGDGFNPNINGADSFFAEGAVNLIGNSTFGQLLNGIVTLDVPIIFGSPQALTLRLDTIARADVLVSEGYRINSDFLNTVRLSEATIRDADGHLLPGGSLSSSNGYSYGALTSAPAPVPEPSTLTLMLIGGSALYRKLDTRKRRASLRA